MRIKVNERHDIQPATNPDGSPVMIRAILDPLAVSPGERIRAGETTHFRLDWDTLNRWVAAGWCEVVK